MFPVNREIKGIKILINRIVREDLSIFSYKTCLCVCLKEYVTGKTEILKFYWFISSYKFFESYSPAGLAKCKAEAIILFLNQIECGVAV